MRLPRFVLDPIIRRKARFSNVPVDRYEIRVARATREYEEAFRLVHVGYVFQGIERLRELDLRMTEQHVLPEATVLVAYEGDQLVGTASVTLDSPAGLPLDKDYPEAIAELRRSGARVAEVGSLAVVRRCWRTGVAQLLGLAASRLSYRILGASHQLIGVHPKGQGLYQALFAFEIMGAPRHHANLEAPVVGLVQERERGRAHMRRHFSRPMTSGVLPRDYTFGPAVPKGLLMPEDLPVGAWPRWKMSRQVFQELFAQRPALIQNLSTRTFRHLKDRRSDQTVGVDRRARLRIVRSKAS